MASDQRAALRRLRYRVGRWLIYPEAMRIWRHYSDAADVQHRKGNHNEENNCTYIALGAKYVGNGWRRD